MSKERTSDLLYDTASTLRLLDAELDELAPRRPAATATSATTTSASATSASVVDGSVVDGTRAALPLLPEMFARAMGEVHAMLASIRTGREQIRTAATERLAHTNEKLDEVSTATGKAALDIMDALDRAILMVDELETDAVLADVSKGVVIRAQLRDELFDVMGHMQFHDITSQQIMYVQSLLAGMEERLSDIANMFDHPSGDGSATQALSRDVATRSQRHARSFDPDASLTGAESRQALADALVERGVTGG